MSASFADRLKSVEDTSHLTLASFVNEDERYEYQLIFNPSLGFFTVFRSDEGDYLPWEWPKMAVSFNEFLRGLSSLTINSADRTSRILFVLYSQWNKTDKREICNQIPLNSFVVGDCLTNGL